ncbi:MAG: hypothetical protein R3Y22_04140 [Bacteroidales bacterium]
MENTLYYPYYEVNYRTFNYNCPYTETRANNLISTKDGQIIVQPMWRMEILGKHFGINIGEYEDNTNYEYYDEVMCQLNTREEREEFRNENYHTDRFDDYFERLAEIAAWVGCERAEIKCLVKSLINKYSFDKVREITDFPFEAFNKLYNRLISSKDIDQLRVAERISRYHIKELERFLRCDVGDKIMRVDWVEEE